ncbi:MAG: lytic transglycosylase domain-containing protein [Myxococcota bacterium]
MRSFPVTVALWGFAAAFPAGAEGIYRYVEADGTIVYTNVKPTGAAARKARRLSGTFHRAPEKSAPLPKVTPRAGTAVEELDDFIETSAKRYRIPAPLVRAVMHAESAFDVNAVSPKGASGLMQLMPATAREMYVKDIFDAKENIEGGTRYLRVLANLFEGDMVRMVAAYNAGPDAVKKYGGQVPPYEETQAYVRKVIALYFQYKAQAESKTAAAARE